jgi:hypothetical protein
MRFSLARRNFISECSWPSMPPGPRTSQHGANGVSSAGPLMHLAKLPLQCPKLDAVLEGPGTRHWLG